MANIYIAPDPASWSQALYIQNIWENKLHLIKSRFKQMCFKTSFFKAPIDLQSVIDPSKALHSLKATILKAQSLKPLRLLRGTANWLETVEHNV